MTTNDDVKPKKRNGYQVCGANRLEYQQIFPKQPNLSLRFTARTTCVSCGRGIEVPYGVVMTVFKVGQEPIGLVCDACVSPATRAELARRRSGAMVLPHGNPDTEGGVLR